MGSGELSGKCTLKTGLKNGDNPYSSRLDEKIMHRVGSTFSGTFIENDG